MIPLLHDLWFASVVVFVPIPGGMTEKPGGGTMNDGGCVEVAVVVAAVEVGSKDIVEGNVVKDCDES